MQKHTVRPDTADSYKNLPVSQREVSPAAAPCNHIISKLKKDKIETGGCIGQLEDISQKKKQENHSEKKNGKRALGIQCPHLAKEMSKIKPKVQ